VAPDVLRFAHEGKNPSRGPRAQVGVAARRGGR
jgi:hypothetical protein